MAETQKRRIDIQITGADNGASAAMKDVGQAAQKMAGDVQRASAAASSGAVNGPAVRGRFDADTQLIRDKMAGRIRAMRDAGKRAQIEEQVNARIFGQPAAPAPGLPALTDADFGRSASRYRAPIGGAGRNAGMLKSITQEGEQLTRMANLVRGAGALAVVSQFGQALQRLPELMEKWKERASVGVTVTENLATSIADAVPVIGDLAKGFKAVLDELSGAADLDRARKREEAYKKEVEGMKSRRDTARQPFLDAASRGAEEAGYRRKLVGKEGDDLVRAQAGVDLERELKEIEGVRAKVRTMGDDQRLPAEAQLAQREAVARAEHRAKLDALDRASNKRTIEDARQVGEFGAESAELLARKAEEARQLDLANQGRHLQAKLAALDAAAEQEIRALRKKHDEEEKALAADPVNGRGASSVRDNAAKRLEDETAAVRANQKRQRETMEEADRREREETETQHGRRMLDSQTDLVARRLAMEGKDQEAQQLLARRAYQKRLEDIHANLEEQVRAHKEREPELRQQAREQAEAAAQEYALTQEEIAAARADTFRVGLPGGVAADSPLKGLIGPLGLAGGAGSPADRTAKGVEKTNEHLAKLNKVMDRVEKNLGRLEPVGVVSGN